jgi:hypothetical protein
MGQYYIAVILGQAQEGTHVKEFIRAWLSPHHYANGAKLMEHSYIGNPFMNAVEWLLSRNGHFWKSRLAWAGDYADPEADGKTLYELAQDEHEEKEMTPSPQDMSDYHYIVNHTKKQWVDKRKVAEDGRGFRIHPLSLLTAEGNGRGGGDYSGANEELVGTWTRDVISVEQAAPEGFTELEAEVAE